MGGISFIRKHGRIIPITVGRAKKSIAKISALRNISSNKLKTVGNVFSKGMKSIDFNSALEGAVKLEKRHKSQGNMIKKLNRIIQKG